MLAYFSANVKAGETWLDIGANCGYTAIALCKQVGSTGRVFAFEPMAATAGCLSQTGHLNRLGQLTVVPIALENCQDIAIEALSSINGMVDSTLKDDSGPKETFLASRLDWLWSRIAGTDPHIDGIKIDVQGMEIQVLQGMASLLKQFHPKLLVEIHPGVSRPDLIDLIASFGYHPKGYAIEPLPGESEPLYADDRTYVFSGPTTISMRMSEQCAAWQTSSRT
ncbi:MAG: FkbM family methyltransferase [Terracidiphilus sp.]